MRPNYVLTTLKVLATLQEGQKVTLRSGLASIDKNTSGILRWINGDNRKTTLCYVDSVVTEAILFGHRKELLESVEGIKTLRVTYTGDEATIAYIDLILDKINKFASS
jgi:hypothetical protein